MGHKTKRILYIYKNLLSNKRVNVKHMSKFFNTNERTIQRDIEDIKQFLNEQNRTILHERATYNYYIAQKHQIKDNEDNIHVTYEMTYDIYKELKKQYETYVIQKKKQTIKVVLSIPISNAIDICFYYRKSIRIISPENVIKELAQEIAKIQMNYILNKI